MRSVGARAARQGTGGAIAGAAALAALGAASCSGLLGIGDRSLDPTLADASTLQEGSGGTPDSAGGGDDAQMGADTRGPDASSSDAPGSDAPGPDASSGVDGGRDAAPDVASCSDPCLLASGLNHPFLMTSDSQNVYWTEFGDTQGSANGFVKGCPVTGCGAGPLVYAQGLTNPRGVAVDTTNIYFGTATYGGVAGAIWKCPLSGCSGSPTRLSAAVIPYGVAVDGSSVYWVDNDDGTVHKVAKGGGTDVLLYDGGSYDDAGDTLSLLGQCVVDGPYLYFGDYSEDVFRLSVNGDVPLLLGNGFNNSVYGSYFGLATDTAHVYSGGNGIILSASKTVANSGATMANGIALPLGVAFDPASGFVYWASFGSGNGNDGTVGKVATDGGSQRVLQSALVAPEAVAVSGSYVLWISNGTLISGSNGTNPGTGALWRTAK